jgi:hypothetical protein
LINDEPPSPLFFMVPIEANHSDLKHTPLSRVNKGMSNVKDAKETNKSTILCLFEDSDDEERGN